MQNLDVVQDILDHDYKDENTCSSSTIESKFNHRYVNLLSSRICQPDLQCSSLSALSSSHIAVVVSDGSVAVVEKEKFQAVHSYSPHQMTTTGLRFSPVNGNLVFTSSIDGTTQLFDLRSKKIEKSFVTGEKKQKKPLISLDISPDERLIAAGTELIGEDSFLLFWDLRNENKLLGGYWESHSDDICSVKFNPEQASSLATSGIDGIINVFDTSQTSEDDALIYCLSTDEVVSNFSWRNQNKKVNLLGHTDLHSIQLWDIMESGPSLKFNRDEITKAMFRKVSDEVYTIFMDHAFGKNPIILAGSGQTNPVKSSCLRTLRINEKLGCLEPHGLLVTTNQTVSSVTQSAHVDPTTEDIITVGEDGVVSYWKYKGDAQNDELKMKNVKSNVKLKPY